MQRTDDTVLDCRDLSMHERQSILSLATRASSRGEELYLATVVHVEGSSCRKPGRP